MGGRDTERKIPLWVWLVILAALLWGGVWYLGFSLPAHLHGASGAHSGPAEAR